MQNRFFIGVRCLIGVALGLLGSSVAWAAGLAAESPLMGVWRATVGAQQVMVCFDTFDSSYYYLRHFTSISLSAQDPQGRLWLEGEGQETQSTWTLDGVSGDHLSGAWSKNADGPALAIWLTRVKVNTKDQEGCSYRGSLGAAFNAPRVSAQKIEAGEPREFMTKPYRRISAMSGKVSSLALVGDSKGIARANQMFRAALRVDISGLLNCSAFGGSGDYSATTRLRFWNDTWMTWSASSEGYCGGAHPFFNSDVETLNLHTGHTVDLWTWFKLSKKQPDSSTQVCAVAQERCLPEKLSRVIVRSPARYEEKMCKGIDFHANSDGYSVGLAENGVMFVPVMRGPSRAMTSCFGNMVMPFADLAPYLSKTGLAAVKGILEEPTREPLTKP